MAVRLVLPVLLTVGLSAGALLGVTLRQPNLLTAGAGGDSSGAGGALVILVTAAMSFVVSGAVGLIGWFRGGQPPTHIWRRVGFSLPLGAVIGAVAGQPDSASVVAAWVLLAATPAVLSWTPEREGPRR